MSPRAPELLRLVAASVASATLLAGWAAWAGPVTHVLPDSARGVSTGTIVTTSGSDVTISGGTIKGTNLFDSFTNFDLGTGDTATWSEGEGGAAIANVINRVTGGAPSSIDGTIVSDFPNAAFYFINPAGVVFGSGARVNVPAAAYFSTASSLRFSDRNVFSATTPRGSTLTVAAPESFGFLGGEGNITLDGANLTLPGKLSISASNVYMRNATIQSGALDLVAAGRKAMIVSLNNPLATEAIGGALSLTDSQLATSPGPGSTGDLNVGGGDVGVSSSSQLGAFSSGIAAGGSLTIHAHELEIGVGAQVVTGTYGDRAAGGITISVTDGMAMEDGSLGSFTLAGGRSGNVSVRAGSLSIRDFSTVFSESDGTGNAGNISINTDHLLINNSSEVTSEADDFGRAGSIIIAAAKDVSLYSGASISDITFSSGNGGDIDINTDSITLSNAGLSANTYATGNAGSIDIRTNNIVIEDSGFVSSASTVSVIGPFYVSGSSGSISMSASGSIGIEGNSSVSTETDVFGSGGNIVLQAGNNISVEDGSVVEADTLGFGSAGTVTVNSGSLSVEGGSEGLAKIASDAFGFGTGAAGDVKVQVNGRISIENGAEITATAGGLAQNAGDVTVRASDIFIRSGPNQQEATGIFSEDATFNNSAAGFSSGSVNVNVGGELRIDGGEISSAGFNAGSGGDVTVAASSVFATNTSYILSKYDTPDGTGHAGSVAVKADVIDLSENTTFDSSANGAGGGDAGSVTVNTHSLRLQSGASIKTNSVAGDAGGIAIDFPAGGLLTIEGSTPTATTEITTSSGTDKAGEINVNGAAAVILNGGALVATGPFHGAHVGITAGALIESTDRPNTIDVTGVLVLDTDVVDVNQAMTRPNIAFIDASRVLRGQCAALEASGATSNLITRLAGPYVPPVAPEIVAMATPLAACGPAPAPNWRAGEGGP